MKKMIAIVAVVALFTACNGSASTEATTTDSTVVKADTTKVCSDSTKCDTLKKVDTGKKAK